MADLILLGIFISLVIGLIALAVLRFGRSLEQITWLEFAVCSVFIMIIIAPVTGCTGWNVAKANEKVFHEYYNGWETEAVDNTINCSVNGSCNYHFDCNCHIVTECVARDEDGNCTRYESHTECDSCPYFTYERDLSIGTTLGNYYIGRFAPFDYRSHMKTSRLPGGFGPEDYIPPQKWTDVKARIDAGKPGPVTKRFDYDNYLLAADEQILKAYSGDVTTLKEQKLLPPLQNDVRDLYQADKVSFVGFTPANKTAWESSLAYLNAGLGTELQGDVHLVIVKSDVLTVTPDAYLFAIKAYWQNPKEFGKDALSKNTIVVVIGTDDGNTVSWSRGTTGMPVGNEAMLTQLNYHLEGVSLTPETLIGNVSGELYQKTSDKGKTKTAVVAKHQNGALERIFWGIDDPTTKFARVSMTARDINDIGDGVLYLDTQIEPSGGQKVVILIFIVFLSCLLWIAAACINPQNREVLVSRDNFRYTRRSW